MYKILTLGESFIFSSRNIPSSESGIKKRGEGHGIRLGYDVSCDYILFPERMSNIYLPDLYRALMVYIYRVRGLPFSEYEIKIGKNKIILPDYNGKTGGNVGKCKLLLSDNRKIDNIETYIIATERGKYFSVFCDNFENFDSKRLLSRIYGTGCAGSDINALLLLSARGDSLIFDMLNIGQKKTRLSSLAFAAAFCLAVNLGMGERVKVLSGDFLATCENTDSGILVFDDSPEAYKLFT